MLILLYNLKAQGEPIDDQYSVLTFVKILYFSQREQPMHLWSEFSKMSNTLFDMCFVTTYLKDDVGEVPT
jgi:hypothetical protein